jgi:hypothetical protein
MKTQMKSAWDNYLDKQLADPTVRQAFEEETNVLGIGIQLAKQRKHGADDGECGGQLPGQRGGGGNDKKETLRVSL